MDFAPDARTEELVASVWDFQKTYVEPNEAAVVSA